MSRLNDRCQTVTPIWQCDRCGRVKRADAGLHCRDCGKGEMLYRGEVDGLVLIPWEESELEHGYCSQCFYVGWSENAFCPRCEKEGIQYWLWPVSYDVLCVFMEKPA